MFGVEKALFDQLIKLKDEFSVMGIKSEFEAEGSSFRDIMRLRRLTLQAGVKLFLKIGGVESFRDLKDALELGVDGIIAPMVESPFGARKFLDATDKIYKDCCVSKTLNLETKNAVQEFDKILEYSKNRIDNITIGRTDLTGSYFDDNIKPDSDFTFELLLELGKKARANGINFTVGGGVSGNTIKKMAFYPELKGLINKLETRKVMLPTKVMLENDGAINEALKFEELYILSKKEFSDNAIESEVLRLTELKRRRK